MSGKSTCKEGGQKKPNKKVGPTEGEKFVKRCPICADASDRLSPDICRKITDCDVCKPVMAKIIDLHLASQSPAPESAPKKVDTKEFKAAARDFLERSPVHVFQNYLKRWSWDKVQKEYSDTIDNLRKLYDAGREPAPATESPFKRLAREYVRVDWNCEWGQFEKEWPDTLSYLRPFYNGTLDEAISIALNKNAGWIVAAIEALKEKE